jgi:hypothetical protein
MILHIFPTWHEDYVRIITMPEELPLVLAEIDEGRIIDREHIFALMSHPSMRQRYSDVIYHASQFESLSQ